MEISGNRTEFDARRMAMARPVIVVIALYGGIIAGLFLLQDWPPPIFAQFLGAASTVFLAQALLSAYAILFTKKPGLVVSDDGLFLRASFQKAIPWSDIASLRILLYMGRFPVLEVRSKSATGFSVPPTAFRRFLRYLAWRPYSREIIDISALVPSPAELVEASERYVTVDNALGEKSPFILDRTGDRIIWRPNPARSKKSFLFYAVLWVLLTATFFVLIHTFDLL